LRNKIFKHIFLLIAVSLLTIPGLKAQQRLMIKGSYVVMSGGLQAKPIYLVVANSATNAITNLGSGTAAAQGGIITESEFNQVLWNIGSTIAGPYTIPFSNGKNFGLYYIPLTISVTAAGIPNGATGGLTFSTWGGETNGACCGNEYLNSAYMPAQVANMDNANTGLDDSPYVVDRFWVIDGLNFTNPNYFQLAHMPAVTLGFTYLDGTIGSNAYTETAATGDLLAEANLIPQRWNSTLGKWDDWLGTATITPGSPYANVGQATNAVITSGNFFRAWTLSSSNAPLPIQLVSFTAVCQDYYALIQWTTATETNNDYFTIERTQDGINYTTIQVVKGAGTSSTSHTYIAIDESPLTGISYYRISQTDLDGTTRNLNTAVFEPCVNDESINAFCNDGSNIYVQINSLESEGYTLILTNTLGQTITTQTYNASIGLNNYKLQVNNVARGIYILHIIGKDKTYSKKLSLGAR